MRIAKPLLVLASATLLLGGCQSAYYGMMGLMGKEKRDLLVSGFTKAEGEQLEAQEQIKTTFEKLQELSGYEGGEIKEIYESFSDEYEESKKKADKVSERIEKIETVAEDFYAEWEEGASEFSNTESGRKLKRRRERLIAESRAEYGRAIGKMKEARDSMTPVLAAFKDQVLALEDSLNADALSSLRDVADDMQGEVAELIESMQLSIEEAKEYRQQLEGIE